MHLTRRLGSLVAGTALITYASAAILPGERSLWLRSPHPRDQLVKRDQIASPFGIPLRNSRTILDAPGLPLASLQLFDPLRVLLADVTKVARNLLDEGSNLATSITNNAAGLILATAEGTLSDEAAASILSGVGSAVDHGSQILETVVSAAANFEGDIVSALDRPNQEVLAEATGSPSSRLSAAPFRLAFGISVSLVVPSVTSTAPELRSGLLASPSAVSQNKAQEDPRSTGSQISSADSSPTFSTVALSSSISGGQLRVPSSTTSLRSQQSTQNMAENFSSPSTLSSFAALSQRPFASSLVPCIDGSSAPVSGECANDISPPPLILQPAPVSSRSGNGQSGSGNNNLAQSIVPDALIGFEDDNIDTISELVDAISPAVPKDKNALVSGGGGAVDQIVNRIDAPVIPALPMVEIGAKIELFGGFRGSVQPEIGDAIPAAQAMNEVSGGVSASTRPAVNILPGNIPVAGRIASSGVADSGKRGLKQRRRRGKRDATVEVITVKDVGFCEQNPSFATCSWLIE